MAQTFMTEEEILNTMPGSTIFSLAFSDGKTKAKQVIEKPKKEAKKKGKIVGDLGGEPYQSKWYVKKGQWCEEWPGGSACWQLERVNDTQIRVYDNGKPHDQLWKVVKP